MIVENEKKVLKEMDIKRNERCNYCNNYMVNIDRCKFCNFEADEWYTRDDWDILNLDDDIEWSHLQILYRLLSKGLPCLFVNMWNDDIVYLSGCNVFPSKIAKVLNIHQECIYNESDQAFMIINLYQEKCIRKKENNIYGD